MKNYQSEKATVDPACAEKNCGSSRSRAAQHNRFVLLAALVLTTILVALMSACDDTGDTDSATPDGEIETIAGTGGEFDYHGDGGLATDASLGYVTGIAVSSEGDVFITDGAANVVRKISAADKKISTITGAFLGFNVPDPTPHMGDGGPASAGHLNVPFGLAVAANGDIYIADAGNHVVRRIEATTGTINVFAGTYTQPVAYAGDGGQATSASLHTPYDVAVDPLGNVFIVDKDNHAIRQVSKETGIISTIAGGGPSKSGYSGDAGPAVDCRLNNPMGIAIGDNGDIYIADAGNHVIRRIDAVTGNIVTVAGLGEPGYNGDGGPATAAQLSSPTRICVDNAGNIYIADHGNHVIRKIDPTGAITTIAGTGTAGYSGDGGLAVAAQLSSPFGVAMDAEGNILVTDNGNSVIRKIEK